VRAERPFAPATPAPRVEYLRIVIRNLRQKLEMPGPVGSVIANELVVGYALAALGFMAASGGSAMLILGHRLFDEIEVSSRWRGRADLVFSDGASMTDKQIAEPAMLVVGRDVDGSWTVRESARMLMGRLASAQAAERSARAERGGVSAISIATSAGSVRRLQGRLTLGSRLGSTTDATHG